MRLLVTGASGFIGRNVLLRAPRDWQVLAQYHRTPLEPFLRLHGLNHVTPLACDLLDTDAIKTLSASAGAVDAVLYLAANGDPALSAEQPSLDLALNTTALVNFLEHVRASHLVYVSSGAVYDGLRGEVTPATAVAPRLPYAISKLACEHYVRFFAERRRSIGSYVNVRFFGAYGPHEAPRKITTKWLRAVIAGQREFTLRGNGENLIDFMYVDDAVDGLLSLVRAAGRSLTVDFASGTPVTINALVAEMAKACGVAVTVRHQGHTEEFIEFRSADRTMRDQLGFTTRVSLEEGLRKLRMHLSEASAA